jgi:hypothetical protein
MKDRSKKNTAAEQAYVRDLERVGPLAKVQRREAKVLSVSQYPQPLKRFLAREGDSGKTASGYGTNLAAEFYVLSCLQRRGLTANLTLGNKKGVDIVVVREAGDAVTVEVKGVAKKFDWPANNLATQDPQRHFVALISFEGRISEPSMPPPRVWIFPYAEIERLKHSYPGGRTNVKRKAVLEHASEFENAWNLIEGVSPRREASQER